MVKRTTPIATPPEVLPAIQAGRPSGFSPAIGLHICEQIAAGTNLNALCKVEGYPSVTTVYNWFRNNPEFLVDYERAREQRADSRADRIDDIARRTMLKPDHDEYVDPQAARVAIDAMKWQAGKEQPTRYGDKLELSGSLNLGLADAISDGRKRAAENARPVLVSDGKQSRSA